VRIWAFIACVLLAGCELYVGEGDDDDVVVDAGPAPDAMWCGEGLRCSSTCEQDLPCPNESSGGNHTVCGRLWDVETGEQLAAALDVRFYDALLLANDPAGAMPLPYDSLYLDDCGRFQAQNIAHPTSDLMAIGVDDAANALDDHRLTAVAFWITPSTYLTRVRAPSLRSSTDASWTSQLGIADGSVVDHGASLVTYRDDVGNPLAGVAIADGNAGFADLDATTHTSPVTSAVTGANGTALFLQAGIFETDCNAQAVVAAGALFVTDAICTTLPD
jgi:hypothetical protein